MRSPRFAFAAAIVTIAIVALLSHSAAQAGDRAHDGGFFLRLSAGFSGAGTSATEGSDKVEISGGGGDLNFAIGGVVANNLALHGTFWGWLANDPEVTASGTVTGSVNIPGSLSLSGVGAGLTYYFMPVNLYLSGSAGVSSLELDVEGIGSGNTDAGFVLDLTLGKEWWVGQKWGLGLAMGYGYHTVEDTGVTWSGSSFSIRFSATMN